MIIVVLPNRFEWRLKLSNIGSCRAYIVVDILCKSAEIVVWILALCQLTPELIILSLQSFIFFPLLSNFSLLWLDKESILFLQFLNLFFLIHKLFCFLLDFCIFIQPICKVLNWIPWFLSASHSKTFWEDKTNIVPFIVWDLWMLSLYACINRFQFREIGHNKIFQ